MLAGNDTPAGRMSDLGLPEQSPIPKRTADTMATPHHQDDTVSDRRHKVGRFAIGIPQWHPAVEIQAEHLIGGRRQVDDPPLLHHRNRRQRGIGVLRDASARAATNRGTGRFVDAQTRPQQITRPGVHRNQSPKQRRTDNNPPSLEGMQTVLRRYSSSEIGRSTIASG